LPTVSAAYFLPVKWQMFVFFALADLGGCFPVAVVAANIASEQHKSQR
jgi:hypothetical protein